MTDEIQELRDELAQFKEEVTSNQLRTARNVAILSVNLEALGFAHDALTHAFGEDRDKVNAAHDRVRQMTSDALGHIAESDKPIEIAQGFMRDVMTIRAEIGMA